MCVELHLNGFNYSTCINCSASNNAIRSCKELRYDHRMVLQLICSLPDDGLVEMVFVMYEKMLNRFINYYL